jgi:hypothetical protein
MVVGLIDRFLNPQSRLGLPLQSDRHLDTRKEAVTLCAHRSALQLRKLGSIVSLVNAEGVEKLSHEQAIEVDGALHFELSRSGEPSHQGWRGSSG